MKDLKAKDLALGGILTALTIVTLFISILIPINTFAILTISSCFVPIAIMRSNVKIGILVYLASSIIGFFLVPLDIMIPFILYFGIYGLVKFFIEKLRNMPLEIVLKLVFSNIMLFIGYILFTKFVSPINIDFPIWLLIILAQIAFIIFDYALTLIITFYISKFHNK
ncbi:membrane protein [Clostridium sp. Ade.TY]|uniref:membrane protein n=1 Tax=Clostridium sp. Ade.TY TaxID=1391647 RepID=UPI00040853E7|nr:membrane protein [Clostridium sp. Ade.TY]